MRLTAAQKDALLAAGPDDDYCWRGDGRTMASLSRRGLARATSGFGWRFGGIIELTEEGKRQREAIAQEMRK